MASFGMLRRVILTRATLRNIPEDAILQTRVWENRQAPLILLWAYTWEFVGRVGPLS
jgi:hypothetical protein